MTPNDADPMSRREAMRLLGAGAAAAAFSGIAGAQDVKTEPSPPTLAFAGKHEPKPLKREELHRVGSVVLHEHYFDNLGGDGKTGGDIGKSLAQVYGSVEAWEAEFRRTAMSLAGGSGWCVLTLNAYTGELRNQWMWDHMHGAIAGLPLLVLDMYEHSYHMDYGSAAAKYLDAFLANLSWEAVDQRFQQARRLTT